MDTADIFDVTLFQTPTLCINGQAVNLSTKKGEALLYYLLIEGKASRDRLATLIWGDKSAEQAKRHLRDALYLLRRQIGDVIIAADRYTLCLNPTYRIMCDTTLLESGDISVYHGDFLRDFHLPDSVEYELWVERIRERFRSMYLHRLSELITQADEANDQEHMESLLQHYLREEPLSESMTVLLMQLYQRKKEYGKAAAIYQRLYKLLSDEMGIAPLKGTAALYYDIMEEWNRQAENTYSIHDEDLSNRQTDYTMLEESLASSHTLRAIVLSGAPGVGKTYMVNRLLSSAKLNAQFRITATCYKSKQNTPLYVWQSISASLSQFIIDKNIPISESYLNALSPSIPSSGQQPPADFYSMIPMNVALLNGIRIVAKQYPLLLIFENIQWMDPDSLNLLDHTMRTIDRGGILVLATCSPPFSDGLSAFFNAAQEDHLLLLHTLLPFTREETFLFIEQYSKKHFSDQAKERIYAETNGNAFMLLRLLDYLCKSSGDVLFQLSVKDELTFRTNGLGKDSLNILNMIAMFPEYAPYEALCQLSRKPSMDLLLICHDLSQRMIINEYTDGGQLAISFVRSEYREHIYSNIPPFDRKVIHKAIVDVLTSIPPDKVPDREAVLEYQCRQAGDPLGALEHKVTHMVTYIGGTYDLFQLQNVRFAGAENTDTQIEKIEQELNQLQYDYKNDPRLNSIRELILYLKSIYGISTGNYTMGLPAVHEMLLRCSRDSQMQVIAHRQMANYAIQIHNLSLLEEHVNAGLATSKRCNDQANLAALERYLGFLYILQGNYRQAREALNHSLDIIDKAYLPGIPHDAQASYAHNYIGDSYLKEGNYQKALAEYETALKIIEPHSYMTCRPIFYSGKGQALLALGEYSAAKAAFENALKQFSIARNLFAESIALSFSALFACADRDYARTEALLQKAEQKANQYQSLYSRSVLELIKAILRKHFDLTGSGELLAILDHPYAYYASQAFLYGSLGCFERELLTNLFTAKREQDDLLHGLWSDEDTQKN